MNDGRHGITGREDDRSSLDLAAILQPDADATRGGIEFGRFTLEQPRAARHCCPEQTMRQLDRVSVSRAWRDDGRRAVDTIMIQQHSMIEEIAGQAGALTQLVLREEVAAGAAGCEIKRIPVTHLARNTKLQNQRFQPGDTIQTGTIRARCAFKAVDFGQLDERAVDLPEQHRSRGGRAATAWKLAIDDDDVQPLAGQPLRQQRTSDAGAHDQRVAFDVLLEVQPGGMPAGKPRRTTATQIGLFGIL